MSSRFSDWFNKVIGSTPVENNTSLEISEDPILPHEIHDNIKQSDYDSYIEYTNIKRRAHIQKAKKQISDYDSKKLNNNPNYKTMSYNIEHEVEEVDDDADTDKALDIEQQKKLGVYSGVEDISAQRKKELELQNAKYNEQKKEREQKIQALKDSLSSYDAKQTREGYKSFAENCKENDDNSDKDEDDEMERVLMEKLGVYNEEDEDEIVRQKRTKKQQAINNKLEKERSSKKDYIASVTDQMNAYHEANKNRANYHNFDCQCEQCNEPIISGLYQSQR